MGCASDRSLLRRDSMLAATVCPMRTPAVLCSPSGTCANECCCCVSSCSRNDGYNATRTSSAGVVVSVGVGLHEASRTTTLIGKASTRCMRHLYSLGKDQPVPSVGGARCQPSGDRISGPNIPNDSGGYGS